jgi:glutathione S-transferase
MVKLYGPKRSNAGRCHILAKEIGLEYEAVPVNLPKGEHNSPEYLKLNPNGKVPCLVDGDFVLWESVAINNYLASKHKPELLGDSLEDKALIDQWSYWGSLDMQPLFHTISFQKFRVPEDRRNEKAIQDAMNALPRVLKLLDEHLSDRKYMLGDKFTLADINLGIAVLGARGAQYDLSDYANISRWMEKLLERPSFKEGLEPPKK